MDQNKFLEEYTQLCEKYKMRLVAEPVFGNRDDGSFSVYVRFFIQPMPEPVKDDK